LLKDTNIFYVCSARAEKLFISLYNSTNSMGTYFITGATGTIGREVVHSLVAQGHNAVAASRSPEQSASQFSELHNQYDTQVLKHVQFDFADTTTYEQAQDADAIFVLAPGMNLEVFALLSPFIDYIDQQSPSKRVVYLSGYGMDALPELPFHKHMEEKLQQTSLDWRVVRPGFFAQNFGNFDRESIQNHHILFAPVGDGVTPFISSKDIGASVAALLIQDEYSQQTFTLTGNEALSYYQVADILSEILGTTITYTNPDEKSYRATLINNGVPNDIANYLTQVYSLIRLGVIHETTSHVQELTGVVPESLRSVLKRDFG
jgi:uncharacterized protein YbjT (DUF2867 family)